MLLVARWRVMRMTVVRVLGRAMQPWMAVGRGSQPPGTKTSCWAHVSRSTDRARPESLNEMVMFDICWALSSFL